MGLEDWCFFFAVTVSVLPWVGGGEFLQQLHRNL